MINSSVCTLFENHYHFGVAALTNSLYNKGFRGHIYAGYRGEIPDWCKVGLEKSSFVWPMASTLKVKEDLYLHFLPLHTDYHLTNYKPDFMLQLLEGPAKGIDNLFYFDPDIVVVGKWLLFEKWVSCGVALCEDVNSPMAENHPRRVAWRKYYGMQGIHLRFKESFYVNGGFVGVNEENFPFLKLWKEIQEKMAPLIGGLNRTSLNGNVLPDEARGEFGPFPKTDQDALNASVEAWDGKVSFIGKEGMAFKSGAPIMSHALGIPKPWQRKPLVRMLNGFSPGVVDRNYWNNSNGPLNAHTPNEILFKKLSINIAAYVGRFYRKR